MVDPIKNSRQEYRLSQEKTDAYGKLGTLLNQAEAEGIHSIIGLPDAIRMRALREVPNFRGALTQLLTQHLQSKEDGEVNKEESEADAEVNEDRHQLIKKIIEGIAEVNRIESELKALELEKEKEDEQGQEVEQEHQHEDEDEDDQGQEEQEPGSGPEAQR